MRNTITSILSWFRAAVPKPGNKSAQVQIGVHFEEVAEMLESIRGDDRVTQSMLTAAMISMHGLALHLKSAKGQVIAVIPGQRIHLLDALCDQAVTLSGVAHMLGMDIEGGLDEVDRSNWTKFVDGQPFFDENQKIKKGPLYTPADLGPYVGSSGVLA
ncbi:hypothetical protein [Roseococcus sp.]|uniref:hypothetical protein n=1 Tax=Roseococcus sp. TaxID=2109646 RepID=UPI003BA99B7F